VKQVVQDIRSGAISVLDVPEPGPRPGYALITLRHSLISAGTERASATLGSKSLVAKARARPDLVRKVVDSARTEGVAAARDKVRARLDQYSAFGYSSAGSVLDTGGDPRLEPGRLVAAVGQGYASHAEIDSVPANLVVPVPDGVTSEEAAFAAPAAIALHAIRLAEIGPGAVVAVVGIGLIGQIAGRLLDASGATAVGTDPRADRRGAFGLARDEHEIAGLVHAVTRGRGVDAVLVTAATPSHGPVQLAAELCRDRGRVVVVGDVGLELSRPVFYGKELELVVARSYGPGRYERAYEEGGLDFPVGYVRWTERRNVEAVLDLLASKRLRLDDLITHRFPVGRGAEAYEALTGDGAALGILLEYEAPPQRQRTVQLRPQGPADGRVRTALIGAGNFMRGTIVPALSAIDGIEITTVVARSGAGARSLADRVGASSAATDWRAVIEDGSVDAIVIATPHAEHAKQAAGGLDARKAVFVEKPLAIDAAGLARVAAAVLPESVLAVGHNRRFSPLVQRMARELRGPMLVTMRIAAGPLPADSWLADPEQGGRVLGEISHFVDLAAALVGAPPHTVYAATVPAGDREESLAATLRFSDGSVASIAYAVTPSPGLAKERVEVHAPTGAAVLDDFVRLDLHVHRRSSVKAKRDKGHGAQFAAWAAAARGAMPFPVPVDEQLLVAAASLSLLESARTGLAVTVALPE
jgi:hypothetical protein